MAAYAEAVPIRSALSQHDRCHRCFPASLRSFRLVPLVTSSSIVHWQAWQLAGPGEEGYYVTRDKVHGRRVRRHQIDAALGEFFNNGLALRLDVIDAMHRRLGALIDVMQEHEGHRFYSASLLLLYEGEADEPLKADLRLIDFAHTCKARSHQCRGPDWGLIFGLVELRATLARLLDAVPNAMPMGYSSAGAETSSEVDYRTAGSESESDSADASSSDAEDGCTGDASSDDDSSTPSVAPKLIHATKPSAWTHTDKQHICGFLHVWRARANAHLKLDEN